jgi:dihydrofolate reductase
MPTGHVFIATSLDGFIARPDGALDWLLSRDAPGEDHGYNAFMADIDGLVMGRGTYEAVAGFDPWPYEKPVLVLSSTLAGTPVPPRLEGRIRFADMTPKDAMRQLQTEGMAHVYVDGGRLVQAFLAQKLIADMVITRVPVVIGAGRTLFGKVPADISMTHLKTVTFPSGLVQSHYRVGA